MANRAGALKPRGGQEKEAPRVEAPPWLRLSNTGLILIIALMILEPIWFSWYLVEPLPNAKNIGGNVRRWIFLGRALPEVIPGVSFDQSYLGLALGELSHGENLSQRLPIVGAAGLIAAAALGLGGLMLRLLRLARVLTFTERILISFGLGASGLGAITLLLGRFGLLAPWPIRAGLAVLALVEPIWSFAERLRSDRPPTTNPSPRRFGSLSFLALTGPFVALMILGSMLPSIDFDAIEYHLQGPKEYFQAGRIQFLEHNVYTSMPFSVEMLHLLGMEVLNDWWWGALVGQVLIALHAPAAAGLIVLTASRMGSPRAGWFAGLVYLTTPWVYRLGVLPYVEGPLAYYHAALVWAAVRAWQESDLVMRRRFWLVVGLLAGGAMACKYPALISAVIPFGVVALADALRRRSPATVFAYTLGCALVMAPWLIKNVIDTGNPVYPLGFKVFGGRYWDPAMDQKWSAAHGPRPITAGLFWDSLVDVAGRSDWQSPLYLAFAPLAFVRRDSRRFAWTLGGYVAYLFLTWWLLTHRLDRFWLPMLPALAVLAGLGADWTRWIGWSILAGLLISVAYLTNLSYSTTALAGLNEWTADLEVLRSEVPRMLNAPLAQLDQDLPPDARPLLVGQAAVFHLNHRVVYNTVFDDETFETFARDASPEQVRDALTRLGITHIYVDWREIERYRSPGNYGFTPFVVPAEFERLVKAGVLDRPTSLGEQQELYRVRPVQP